MVLGGRPVAVAGAALEPGDGLLDDLIGEEAERPAGPHRVELHLGRPLDVVEAIVGFRHRPPHRHHPVVGHDEDGLVAEHPGEALPLLRIEGGAGVLHVVAGLHRHPELGLADGEDARVLEPGEGARVRHVGVHHAGRVRDQPVDGGVDAVARELHLALARVAGPVEPDLHERGSGHLRPVQAERDLEVAVLLARHGEGEVVEDPLLEAVHHGEPVGRGEVDAGLPLGLGVPGLALRQGGYRHLMLLLFIVVNVRAGRPGGMPEPRRKRRLCAIRARESCALPSGSRLPAPPPRRVSAR